MGAGLSTVFARDFADATFPWTDYPDDVQDWVTELMETPEDNPGNHWLSRHPDGRRWVGYSVGTYLVDQALQASGKSVVDLVSTPTDEILRMATR